MFLLGTMSRLAVQILRGSGTNSPVDGFQVTDTFGKKGKGQYALATVLSFFSMDNVKAGSANIDVIRD